MKSRNLKKLTALLLTVAILCGMLPAIHFGTSIVLAAGQVDLPNANGALGTEESPYIINEPLDLVWMSDNVATEGGKYYIQTCNIDMTSVTMKPIGYGDVINWTGATPFCGTYDGQWYTISNLSITSNEQSVGLFGYVDVAYDSDWNTIGGSGDIKNITLNNAVINQTLSVSKRYIYCGGIVGYSSANIINCHVTGNSSVTSAYNAYVGGIAGTASSVSGCSNSATISCDNADLAYSIGGILGTAGTISNCSNTGNIIGGKTVSDANSTNWYGHAGGVSGYLSGSCSNCFSSGNITYDPTGDILEAGIIANFYMSSLVNNFFLDSSASLGVTSNNINNTTEDEAPQTGTTAKTSEQLKAKATFTAAGWDFAHVWKYFDNQNPVHKRPPVDLTINRTDGQARLTWGSVNGATGYKVYKGTSRGAYDATPAATTTASTTEATITGLNNGSTYYFVVTTLDVDGESPYSYVVKSKPLPPTGLTAAGNIDNVSLSWDESVGASYYEVYMRTEGGAYSTAPTTTVSGITTTISGLPTNTKYYFIIKACDAHGVSDNSTEADATTVPPTYPEIDLKGNGSSIVNGDTTPGTTDGTDFGNANVSGETVVKTFTIANTSDGALKLNSGVTVSNPDFTVTTQPPVTVASYSSVTFNITFDPSSEGEKAAIVSIANNDTDENPYTFSIKGTGIVTATAPTANPASGSTIKSGANITLSSEENTSIYYTTNGSTPTSAGSCVSTGGIVTLIGEPGSTITLMAYASKEGKLDSDVRTFTYTIQSVHSAIVTGITIENKVYDGTTAAAINPLSIPMLSGIAAEDDVTITGIATASYADKNAINNKDVTVTGYTLTGTDAKYYTLQQPTGLTADITAKTITVNAVTIQDKLYDGTTAATISGSALTGVIGSDEVSINKSAATASFADADVANTKTVNVTGLSLTGAQAGNYKLSSTSYNTTGNILFDGTTTAPAPSIASNSVIKKNTDITLTAETGATIYYTIGGLTPTSISTSVSSGGIVNVTGALGNTVVVKAYSAKTGKHDSAVQTFTYTIQPKQTLTVTGITIEDKVYDGTASAAIAGGTPTVSGIATGDVVSIAGTATAAFANKDVGTNKPVTVTGYTLGGVDAEYYDIAQPVELTADITAKTVSISGISIENKTYDNTTSAAISGTAAANGILDSAALSSTSAKAVFADKNVADNIPVTVSGYSLTGTDAGNYKLVQPTGLTANITVKTITVSAVTIQDKPYDGTTAAAISSTALLGNFASDDVSINKSAATASFADAGVGNTKPVNVTGLSLTGSKAGNYQLSSTSYNATGNILYDGTATAPAPSVANNSVIKKNTDITLTAETGATIYYTIGGLTPTSASTTVTSGGIVSVTGNPGDNVVVKAYSAKTGKHDSAVQTYTYTIQPIKTLTVTGISIQNKVYDGTTQAAITSTPSLIGTIKAGDVVSISGTAIAAFTNRNVGTNKPVTVTGYTLGGADAEYYEIAQPVGLTADITAKTVTISGISIENKTYDNTTSAAISGTAAANGILDSAALSSTSAKAVFADKNVADNIPVTVSGYSLTGTDAGNYKLVQPTGLTASITVKTITVSAVTIQDKPYDGTTAAAISSTALLGNFASDDVSINKSAATASFADAGVGNTKPVNVTGLSLTGSKAGNYQLSSTSYNATGNILFDGTATVPAPSVANNSVIKKNTDITLTAETGANIYYTKDGTTPTSASTIVSNGGIVTVTGDPGDTVVVKAYSAKTGKHDSAVQTYTYTIQPIKTLTVTGISIQNKVYDGTTQAAITSTPSLSGTIKAGDVVSISGTATAAFTNRNVGTNKPVTVTGYTLGGADAEYYTLSQPVALTADITAKTVTISGISIENKTYDNTTSAAISGTAAANGILDSAVLSSTSAKAVFADKNVADNIPVTVSGYSLTGTDAANYKIVQPTGLTASITVKTITVSAVTIQDKPYDGTIAATISGAALTGIIGSDEVSINKSAATASFADAGVANGKMVNVTGLALTGSAVGNYMLNNSTYSTTGNILNNGTTATPTVNVVAGTVSSGTRVSITCTTSGAAIYYTIDGTIPTNSSAAVTSATAITISSAMTIKAIAVKYGMNNSGVMSASYSIQSSSSSSSSSDTTPTPPKQEPASTPKVEILVAGDAVKKAEQTTATSAEAASKGITVGILVDGAKKEDTAKAKVEVVQDKVVVTVAVDKEKAMEKLKEAEKTITIPVKGNLDTFIGQMDGDMIKTVQDKAAVVEVKTDKAAYALPAEEIKIEKIAQQFGDKTELKSLTVNIQIEEPNKQTVQVVENSARQGEFTIVAQPIEFKVSVTNGEKSVEVKKFDSYVERTVAIPEGVDANKITTGIVVEPDGTVRHVPTKIVIIDGKYYAKINSLTNSTYSVVWHPIEFKDVDKHWAKDAVNDMGSRMVITGMGSDNFEPDRDITRAEFAVIVVKGLGLKPVIGKTSFIDVKLTDWYSQYVETAYEYGIITGVGSNKFAPSAKITRQEAMTMIERAMKVTKLKVEWKAGEAEKLLAGYNDSNKADKWAKEGITACVKTGIITGKGAKMIAPKDNITRAEVAAIIKRLLEKSNLI